MSLQKLIDEQLHKQNEERKLRVSSGKFHPSLLGRCFRCQVLTRAGVEPTNPPDARIRRVFKCGQLFHDFVQQFLPKHQVEVPVEIEDFKGRADIVEEDMVDDIKSVHSYSFHYTHKAGYDVRREKRPNWLQLAYYAKGLKKEKMCLMLISKDDLCIDEYVEFTKNWEEALETEINLLRMAWELYPKDLPEAKPRAYITQKNPCAECEIYCDFWNYCKGVERDANREHISDKPKQNRKGSKRS